MGDVRDPNTDQTLPIPNGRRPIVDIVRDDLLERKEHGVRKYGQALQAFNGRDPVQDAFEESVDLMLYFKQLLIENEALSKYTFSTAHADVWCERCHVRLNDFEEADALEVTVAEVIAVVRNHERIFHTDG